MSVVIMDLLQSTLPPRVLTCFSTKGGKKSSQWYGSLNCAISLVGIPNCCMISNWYLARPVFCATLDFLALNLVGSVFVFSATTGFSSSVSSSFGAPAKSSPKSSTSLFSLSAAAQIGIPVQWKPNAKRAFLFLNLSKPTAKSTLE